MVVDSLTLSAPAPMRKYRGRIEIHSDNLALMSGDERAQKLPKKELRAAERELDKLEQELEEPLQLLPRWHELRAELQSAKVEYLNIKSEYRRVEDSSRLQELLQERDTVLHNAQAIRADLEQLRRILRPYRSAIRRRNKLEAQVKSHYTALQDEELDKRLTKEMDKEARLTGALIIECLSRLGYRHKVTRKDGFGAPKTLYKLVRFERVVVTPDTIQFKVDVSRLGLLDGVVDNLPYGVRAADLYKPETLIELSIATERAVSSPNADDSDNCPASRGVWYVVHRLGLSDGVPEFIRYRDVMSRYPEEKSALLPLPMGVKPGRLINWTYLTKQPHIMVNGVTGFGKSNTMRMVLATLVAKQAPDTIRYCVIDMKNQGDFAEFEQLPHSLAAVADIERAAQLMYQLFLEMKRRQELIRKVTNDISKFNSIVSPADQLPHILIVFDEYPAIWVKRKLAAQIDEYAAQIAIQGRASGIHLFIGGQQAYSGDINRLIVANITHRYTSRQNTVGASMSTTGDRSAQRLRPVPGRFLCTTDTESSYVVQMPYIEDNEIREAVTAALSWEPPRAFSLPEIPEEELEELEEWEASRPIPTKSYRELVLEGAFELLDGHLKGHELFALLNGRVPQNKVFKVIRELASEETVEYKGTHYRLSRQRGGSYKLEPEPELAGAAD